MYDESGRDVHSSVLPASHDDSISGFASILVEQGLLKRSSFAGDLTITSAGIRLVDEVRQQRTDLPARAAALRRNLAQWLYGHNPADGQAAIESGFLQSAHSYYLGQPFSADEIIRALGYLRERGLIDGAFAWGGAPIRLRLTTLGVDFVESGKSMTEFLNPQPSLGPTFHVSVAGSQNVAIGTHGEVTQTNTSGIDPAVLTQQVHAASLARESLPGLHLDADQAALVTRLSRELEAEASSEAPQSGRMRSVATSLIDALSSAAGTALGGMVIATLTQAAAALG
ncbi:hypothetical protein AB0D45_01385 [Streptomyces sp. NPDC048352]|uniref:hypothetical protein n=1 Tax=Streptomyces sp. NPDC048352 TaxID=3154718 RepID=UPI003427EE07